jgi:quercetin dioxygenase-like cupin family protein
VRFRIVKPGDLEWETRPSPPGEPRRHAADATDIAGFERSRGSFWRYEPGAKGRRHKERVQEETFVVLAGTHTMYLGDPAERHAIGRGGVIHVKPGTPLQTVNESDEELLAYGAPPDMARADLLDSAV